MGKTKQVGVGRTVKDKLRREPASVLKVLQSPVLNIFADSQSAPVDASCLQQERDVPVIKGRKALCSTQVNVLPGVRSNAPENKDKTVVKESPEYQLKLQALQQLCNASDAEVKSRCDTIRALTAAQYASYKAQLDFQLSKFSIQEQNMPLEEYLKTCPGIKSMTSADGRIQLQKRPSPYPKLEESKRNLQDLLTNVNVSTSKGTNSLSFTPCADPRGEREQQEPEQKLGGEELSWPEYYMRLQSLGFNAGVTPSFGTYNSVNTPLNFKGGLMPGVTPKTLRLPKHGETMLSVNGSPLGQFGKTPASAGAARLTRTSSRLASSYKRSLRDL